MYMHYDQSISVQCISVIVSCEQDSIKFTKYLKFLSFISFLLIFSLFRDERNFGGLLEPVDTAPAWMNTYSLATLVLLHAYNISHTCTIVAS